MYCFLLYLISCSCNKKIEIRQENKNPTEYEFHFSKDKVEKAITNTFGNRKNRKFCCDSISETNKKYYLDGMSFYQKNKEFYGIKCQSKVYFRKDLSPYPYLPAYIYVIVDSLNNSTTRVSINVNNPKILTGLTLLPTIPWMQRGWKYKNVPATTVEEYQILLLIGKELKEEGMPELKIPPKIIL